MPRTALDTRDFKTEQKPDITGDPHERESDIIRASGDVLADKQYADRLAFNEEPVTIMLQPSTEQNAATWHPASVNGIGAEVWVERLKKWVSMPEGYLPVGVQLIVKRKYVEVLAGSKVDVVNTAGKDASLEEQEQNRIKRFTRPLAALSVIEDRNPRGAEWLSEIVRRNM